MKYMYYHDDYQHHAEHLKSILDARRKQNNDGYWQKKRKEASAELLESIILYERKFKEIKLREMANDMSGR